MRTIQTSAWTSLVAALLSACDAGPSSPSSAADARPDNRPGFSIEDAVHNGGNEHFFWLPPMVSAPSYSGTFTGGLTPLVRICEWDGAACGTLVAEYTTLAGPGSETVRVDPALELYIVNWHTDQFGLDPSKTYRIAVSVDGRELGHADVGVVQNGSQLKNVNTNEFIPLKDGRTLPIKFRIEEGAVGSDITIDASALSAPSVDVRGPPGPIGFFPITQTITIPGDPGTYSIADRFGGNPIPFVITASGVVDYDIAYDAIFSGRGSATLTVLGYQYTVDATPLSTIFLLLGGVGTFSNSVPVTVTELPGGKNAQDLSGGVLFYDLTNQGTISYAASVEPIADGAGTTTLTLVGYDYAVDATALSSPNFLLGGIGTFPTATPVMVTGLPGSSKNVQDISGGVALYDVTAGGLIAYSPAVDVFADGQGTTTLTLVGHQIIVDATQKPGTTFTIAAIGGFSSNTAATVVVLPGTKTFISADLNFTFTVDGLGLVDYAASLDAQVTGRGTNTLTILP